MKALKLMAATTLGLALVVTQAMAQVGSFRVILPNNSELQGQGRRFIPASATPAGSLLRLRGRYVELDVEVNTLAIVDYTLTGVPHPRDITEGTRTTIYSSVRPILALPFNSMTTVFRRGDALILSRRRGVQSITIRVWDRPGETGFEMASERRVDVVTNLAPGFEFSDGFYDSPDDDTPSSLEFTNGVVAGSVYPENGFLGLYNDRSARWRLLPGGASLCTEFYEADEEDDDDDDDSP